MTWAPLVVRETTNLDAAARYVQLIRVSPRLFTTDLSLLRVWFFHRLLLETKYHRLPVVDSTGKLVSGGIYLSLHPLCFLALVS
jgi:CBS domain-containing protein